jgi:hypothetical protein
MKGLVFREFLGMVEEEFGYETVDAIIEKSKVPSKGVYTSVGTYNVEEMFALVGELSREKDIPADKLLFVFGKYIFSVFLNSYPHFFKNKNNSFHLLADVEDTIHVEVLKLYPEAELPSFEVKQISENELSMLYQSTRRLSDFAEGIVTECLLYFKENATIKKEMVKQDGSVVLFTIVKSDE